MAVNLGKLLLGRSLSSTSEFSTLQPTTRLHKMKRSWIAEEKETIVIGLAIIGPAG